MSKNPVVHMEVAFETDPLTRPGDEDWTEVTSEELPETERVCVNALRTSRGARIRTGEIVPGRSQASVQFPNRVFEPLVSSSPWYPNVDLGKRVRYVVDRYPVVDVSDGGGAEALPDDVDGGDVDPETDVSDGPGADEAGVPDTEVIWTGFIESLPTSWSKKVAGSVVAATGLLGQVANVQLPPSVLHHSVLTSMPGIRSYWPMTESAGTFADDIKGTNDGEYQTPITSTGQLVPFDLRPCTQITATSPFDPAGQNMIAPIVGNAEGMSFGAWFKWERNLPREGMIPLIISHTSPTSTGVAIRILPELDSGEPTGKAWIELIVQVGGEGLMLSVSDELFDLFTAAPHHIGMALSKEAYDGDVLFPGIGLELYLDGEAVEITTDRSTYIGTMTKSSLGVALDGMTQIFVGLRSSDGTLDQSDAPVATIGHAFFADVDSGQVNVFQGLYEAGANPWAGDTTDERLERILDLAGVDADDRDIAVGTETCGPALLGGTVGAYLKLIAGTESAPLFESPDGKITFGTRTPNDPDIAFVLSDNPTADSGTPFEPVDADYSKARMINTAEVTRVGGNPQTTRHAASVQAYGEIPIRIDTLHESPDEARATGARIVSRAATPRRMFDNVTVSSRHSAEVPAAVSLGGEIGDAIEVYARPDDDPDGDPLQVVAVVESVEQQLDKSGSWKTRFGVFEHVVLPCFALDDPDAGLDDAVFCEGA